MFEQKGKNSFNIIIYNTARIVAVIAFIFSFILTVLIVANYIQLASVDPLNNQTLSGLLARFDQNQQDEELKEQIRALDLLARKAFFAKQWQLYTGGLMLFGGIIVLIVCLRLVTMFEKKLPQPRDQAEKQKYWFISALGRRIIAISGTTILAVSIVIIILSYGLYDYPLTISQIEVEGEETELPDTTQNQRAALLEKLADYGEYPTQAEIDSNWPYFRGPATIGLAVKASAPTDWDVASSRGVLWKTAVPRPGYSSPIIWDGLVFISGGDKEQREVYCFDAHTGELIWRHAVEGIPGTPEVLPEVTADTGYAAPTMCTDGRRVFAIFATGDILSIDFEGKRVWARNLGVPINHYGHSSSLIMYKSLLLVQYDQQPEEEINSWLFALAANSGETVWQTERDVLTSWCSPALIQTQEYGDQVILCTNPIVAAYDPLTGELLWEVDYMLGETGPSPAYANGLVFTVDNQYGSLVAIDLSTNQIVWEFYEMLPDVSSPLAINNLLFFGTSFGPVFCLAADSGEVIWTKEYETGFYSSPVLLGENIYYLDRKGMVRIFKARDTFMPVANIDMGEPVDTTPAYYDGRLYIRGQKHLFCLGE
jgi:outer membrane protein assembly factor BamB